jgi:hypothetical protein
MTDFQIEIAERLTRLKEAKELTNKKRQFDKVYSMALIDSDWNEIVKVNDFQASFLDVLNERYPALFETIQKPLEDRFYEMYQNSDDENEKKYKPQEELVVHKIQVPSANSDEWQLMYEMNSDDTIFHIEFDGWTFKHIGITH